jgi:hypothetical protein
MLNRMNVAHRCLALMIGPALFYTLGCSDDGFGKRNPVSGTVKYNGQPVAKGRINFVPKGGAGHGAHGEIENGSFGSLTTLNPGDGAVAGDYTVTVDTREIDEAAAKAEGEKLAQKHGMSNLAQLPPEVQAKAFAKAKSSVPAKYQSSSTTDLKATVAEGSNSFEFELKD